MSVEPDPFIVEVPVFSSPLPSVRLWKFHAGDDALTDLVPAAKDLTNVLVFGTGRGAAWCAESRSGVAVYESTPTETRRIPVPHNDCDHRPSPVFGQTRLVLGVGRKIINGLRGATVSFLRDGVSRDVVVDGGHSSGIRSFGDEAIIVVVDPYDIEQPASVWAIWPDNSVESLATDLSHIHVSVAGRVIHVIGFLANGTNTAPVVVRRYRQGQAGQSAQLVPNRFTGTLARIVTSREGAAIASLDGFAWISPSASLAFTQTNELTRVSGGARGSNTVVFSGARDEAGPPLPGAVFAYDEVAGQPRLTRLSANVNDFSALLLDPPLARPLSSSPSHLSVAQSVA